MLGDEAQQAQRPIVLVVLVFLLSLPLAADERQPPSGGRRVAGRPVLVKSRDGLLQGQPDPVAVEHVEPFGLAEDERGQPGLAAKGDDQRRRLLDATQLGQDPVRSRAAVHRHHHDLVDLGAGRRVPLDHLANLLGRQRVVDNQSHGQPIVGQQQVVKSRGQVMGSRVQSHVQRRNALPEKNKKNQSTTILFSARQLE